MNKKKVISRYRRRQKNERKKERKEERKKKERSSFLDKVSRRKERGRTGKIRKEADRREGSQKQKTGANGTFSWEENGGFF